MARNTDKAINRLETEIASLVRQIEREQGQLARCGEGSYEANQCESTIRMLRHRLKSATDDLDALEGAW